MINSIEIRNFKCFHNISATVHNVNLLTGVNGRGKSSFLQSILLLSQSWRKKQYRYLLPNGGWKSLGAFEDIKNKYTDEDYVRFRIKTDDEKENTFSLTYKKSTEQDSFGELVEFSVNDLKIDMATEESMGNNDDNPISKDSDGLTLATIADYEPLLRMKRVYFVSADRVAANEIENIEPTTYLRPDGKNILNFLFQQGDKVTAQVEARLKEVFEGAMLSLEKKGNELVLSMNSIENSELYRPVNVGFGYSYILSVLTTSIIAQNQDIVIIENPEAHLHPSAQSKLLGILINDAMKKGYQLFIESHSDHVVNTALIDVKNGVLDNNNLAILFFSNEKDGNGHTEAIIENLRVTEKGRILQPPRQFCDQYANDLKKLYL